MQRPVMVGVDESSESHAAAEWAAREALLRGLPLRLVHVTKRNPGGAAAGEARRFRIRRVLDGAEAVARTVAPTVSRTSQLLEGPVGNVLLHAAEEAELLVLGSRGLGAVTGAMVGSVARRVTAAAPVPVVLVRDEPRMRDAADVVLGLDLVGLWDDVVGFAFSAAETRGAPLHVVSAVRGPGLYSLGPGEVAIVQQPQRVAEWHGFQDAVLMPWRTRYARVMTSTTLVEGRAVPPLLEASEKAALMVVGRRTERSGRPAHGNGPVTHSVIHHARCPVAIVPQA
ncbi:universal stress protein [Streptomyces sp. KL118A]|uniref:universal stress protein n=1 Tax=Streptomyces sp. KL118A TaxID=3045153 RepID=UPI00278C8CC3|nr:universal stress protein [Streptomyces sp. KL118A]